MNEPNIYVKQYVAAKYNVLVYFQASALHGR